MASATRDGDDLVVTCTGRKKYPVLLGMLSLVMTCGLLSIANTTPQRIVLPVEVLGEDGTVAGTAVTLRDDETQSVRALWLQINGLHFAGQASIQINDGDWIPLSNKTVQVSEPGKSFGGIGGGFATLAMTLPLPAGAVTRGTNTIRFRFNHTDGFVSGYRVLALNFQTAQGTKVLAPDNFVENSPDAWKPPLSDAASAVAGHELWQNASLKASSVTGSPRIQAHCADCHTRDGRDLKYFNFSNESIVTRARFHGLSTLQGQQIASYIRTLTFPSPGRPWNPPYQPGPGVDERPVSTWAAGAGLNWVLDRDVDALPYFLRRHGVDGRGIPSGLAEDSNPQALANGVTPEIFRPDGNLNQREIPISLQLPDWNQWLPRIHPKDAWGSAFAKSKFAEMYGEGAASSCEIVAAAQSRDSNLPAVVAGFSRWSKARHAFLNRQIGHGAVSFASMADKVYSTQLWQLVKTWEIVQESGLEGQGSGVQTNGADSRMWPNTIPSETAPDAAHIEDGPAGVGGSGLTNAYFAASWYELQVLLNSGNHQHRDRGPVDWVYVVDSFRNLNLRTHYPEPVRLLVTTTKAWQSTDPRFGPEDLRQGWRPDQNVDPRIMVNPAWRPLFETLPAGMHQALTTSVLTAWMDKTQRYPISMYLPFGFSSQTYPAHNYGAISGGRVWEAARQFSAAGVPAPLVERVEEWGSIYVDRAARIQYGGQNSSRGN